MARDPAFEAVLTDDLDQFPGLPARLSQKSMFGGLAWLLDDKLLCAVGSRGLLVRLGKGNDAWALALPGTTNMIMQGRPAAGWVRVSPEQFANDELRCRLLTAAIQFVQALPPA